MIHYGHQSQTLNVLQISIYLQLSFDIHILQGVSNRSFKLNTSINP